MLGGKPPERGETIAEFTSYEGAQNAVSELIKAEIPAKDIAIVGRGLRSVETVTGRLGYATAARSGAINGILLGLFFAAIFVLTQPEVALQLFIGVLLVGTAIGMTLSIIMYSIVRRRRDFTSVTQVVADEYDVTVLSNSVHRARETLGRPVAHVASSPAPASADAEPPRYGERVDPAPVPSDDPLPPPKSTDRWEPGQDQPAPPQTGPSAQEPPRYGERLDPAGPQPEPKADPADPRP